MPRSQLSSALLLSATLFTASAYAGDQPPRAEPHGEQDGGSDEDAAKSEKDAGTKKKDAAPDPKDEAKPDKDEAKPKKDEAKADEDEAKPGKDEAKSKKGEPSDETEPRADEADPEKKKKKKKKKADRDGEAKDAKPDQGEKKAAPDEDASKGDGDEEPKKKKKKKAKKAKKKKAVAPDVRVGEPKFMGGEVKLVSKMLEKTRDEVAACVKKHGGLEGKAGFMKVQFLVRVRGRAEGVEVLSRKGVTKKAARCVRKMLKNRWVGTPSNDPVGVMFRYELSRPKK